MILAGYILAALFALILFARRGLHELARRRRWRIGRWSKVLPGWSLGGCLRCRTSFAYVTPHDTPYGEVGGKQCFPLCDVCWRELGGPAARIPFYEELMRAWAAEPGLGKTVEDFLAIRAAVAAGL